MDRTMILAIGGAGCNIAEFCMRESSAEWLKEADYVFADTNQDNIQALNKKERMTISLHKNAETFPDEFYPSVGNLYILAGLGGKTGSIFAEIAAKTAKTSGIVNVTFIVTFPFSFEGKKRIANAKEALDRLSGYPIEILYNDELIESYPNLNFINAFEHSDREALRAIESRKI